MTSIEIIHFAHVLAFALIIGVDLPAFYAAKRASADLTTPDVRLLAARVVRWSNVLSTAAIVLLLPLGVSLGADLGVYKITHDVAITITWGICLVWLALVILSEAMSQSALGNRLYTIEIWVRIIIGLGNIYDGGSQLLGAGTGMLLANWLAVKVLMLGLVMVLSALVRRRLKPVRTALAQINPQSAQMSSWDFRTAQSVVDALKKTRPLVHSIFLLVLIAAWMGINKSW